MSEDLIREGHRKATALRHYEASLKRRRDDVREDAALLDLLADELERAEKERDEAQASDRQWYENFHRQMQRADAAEAELEECRRFASERSADARQESA